MIDPERFGDAVRFAAQRHAGHLRKGTDIPYLAHLLGVCSLVLEAGGDEDEAIAALLHDAIEDTGTTADDITERFGSAVSALVVAAGEQDRQADWKVRKEAYLAELRDPATSSQVLRVSCADKVHNARAILADHRAEGDRLWERFNAGPDAQLWYYTNLAAIFSDRLPGQLSNELRHAVAALEHEITTAATRPHDGHGRL